MTDSPSSERPNFVFFITDQQRADWLGCYGHPVVKTPNIDALAAQGTRFDNFHTASPVCMPNRASLMTGRYPSVHGLRYNGCVLPQNANTFIDVLAAGGYHTAAIGKSHLQPFTDFPPIGREAVETGPVTEAWKPDDADYAHEEPGRYEADGRYNFPTPYYGFQHIDMVTVHGDRCGGHYRQWFREQAEDWQALHDDANELPHNYSCPQAYRTPIPEDLYPTAYVRDRSVEFLKAQAGSDQPFFLFVSFPDPHHPFNPPGKYWDMYGPDQFEVGLPYEAHQNPTPPMQWLTEQMRAGGGQMTPQTAMMLDDQRLREAMALTAGMISMVDDAVGDVMQALRDTGLLDNTVVSFNSDHGDYLGDFNLLLKGALPFRAITRVPFIWSDPASRKAETTPELASTVDIGPTVLARAGLHPYFGMQGESLLPAISGGATERDDLLVEYNDGGARLGFEVPSRVRALLTDRYRLTIYKDQDWGELYDLAEDPRETRNLWDDPNHRDIKLDLFLRLSQQLTAMMDESPRSQRIA